MPKSHRDLLTDETEMTETLKVWKLAPHPHVVIGERRGFQVRLYHDAEWQLPYFIALVGTESGWLMDGVTAPIEAAARAEALDMLASLDGATVPTGRA